MSYRAQQRQAAPPNGPSQSQSHELTNLDANGSRSLESQSGFLAEVTSVQNSIGVFSANVTRIGALNSRALDALRGDDAAIKNELDGLTAETRALSNELRDRIKRLQAAVLPGVPEKREKEMRQNQVALVRTKFTEALQTYQKVEQDSRNKSQQRIARQYRIVKPEATQEEINEVIASGQDQVFMQALTSSTRYDQSRSAYNEVQARAQDLKKMEQTLGELAQLFSDMALLIEQQNETVAAIENTAIDVEKNAGEGLKQTEVAVGIARRLRQKRWICFIITLIVVIILAAVLAVELTKK
ncbi:syntaxin-like protein [Mycena maculata]|uniref:Syntaxin-like protein n=1 Tax=Mycena maculata TaxID=230809 RepID=A0AAD7HEP0_9AGAR|nr:syntaxin-like protein [Mycena maculata]